MTYWSVNTYSKIYCISRDIDSYIGKNWIESQFKRAEPNLHNSQSNWVSHVPHICCPKMVWIPHANQIARKREIINRKSYRRHHPGYRIVSSLCLSGFSFKFMLAHKAVPAVFMSAEKNDDFRIGHYLQTYWNFSKQLFSIRPSHI